MYACVAYDISSNRTRLRASKWCKKIGLLRLQKSVFAGRAAADAIAEMEKELRPMLLSSDKFVVIPLEKPSFIALIQQSNNARFQQLREAFVLFDL